MHELARNQGAIEIDPATRRPVIDPATGRPRNIPGVLNHPETGAAIQVNAAWGLGQTLQDIGNRINAQGIVRDPGGGAAGGAIGAQGPAGAAGAQGPAGAPGRPAPGQGAFIPNGEINVPHNSPEGQIISANVGDIDNYVQSVGGWQNIPDGELMNIYHFRTGQHKAEAARQLRNRNLL
jgi:hypothetical protein